MSRLAFVLLCACLGYVTSFTVTVSLLKPQGVRFSIPDEPGVSLVSFHYGVNQPVVGLAHGQYGVDVNTKTGSEWVHENTDVVVHPGDKVYYWALIIQDGQGHNLENQMWIAAEAPQTHPNPHTTTTGPPTTHTPTTQQPTPATQAPTPATQSPTSTTQAPTFTTQQPIVTASHGGSGTPATSSTSAPQSASITDTAGTQTATGSSSGTNSQTVVQAGSSSGGSCGCTGRSIKPPGSELTCTTFPCMIFEDEFDTLNLDVWEHEITASGGGNWEFQVYTNNRTNSYVRDGKLFIKPTFTIDSLANGADGLMKGALDIWGSQPGDKCTGNAFWGCHRDGNPDHIINPIQSARLRSSRGFNFKYGKVEIRAKMPKGDWIWPAIWMLPLRNAYGNWPVSGEIDIVEARGNSDYHDDKGNDQSVKNAGSTLHFGSDFFHNKYITAHGERLSKSGTYGDDFHIYTLDWDENHISISIDGDEVINVAPQTDMWQYGGLDKDGVDNPWIGATKMAPFDQEFFLIMNVAVGGTAFFPDTWQSPVGKPWSDKSEFAPRDFWNQRGTWYPTWHPEVHNGEDAAMQVDYIRVWKLKP